MPRPAKSRLAALARPGGGLHERDMLIDSARLAPPSFSAEIAGNRLTLLTEGPERLDALIALIDNARTSVRILYYIFKADASGLRVRDALIAAVKRGVRVKVLVDGFGTPTDNKEFFSPLADSDCEFCRFVPRFGRRYLLRNHQKLALADDRVVLVGGFNVADDYFGTIESGAWRDLGLLVEGSSVECLAGYFDSLFEWVVTPKARIRTLRKMLNRHSKTGSAQGDTLHWLFGGPTRRLSPWARAVRRDMVLGSRLDMIAAYFAPSRSMLRRIDRIGKRGEARVITAAKSDNTTTIAAGRHSYWKMLKNDVALYEYQATKLHTKLFIVDGVVHIGSANFDMRSLFLNLEMMLRIDHAGFADAMRRYVDHEIEDSRQITVESHAKERTLLNRVRWGLAHFIVAVIDYSVSRRLNFGIEQ